MGRCLAFTDDTYVVQLFENDPVGTVLTEVTVTDLRQTGRPIQFEFTAGNTLRQFDINQQSGTVTLNASLDFEAQAVHSITVTAFDVGSDPISTQSATATIMIIVLDVNDNPPIFSQPSYSSSVLENNQVGAFVLTVEATDADSEPFAQISFLLENGLDYFQLDNVTGELSALVSFDYEMQQSYSLTVLALDSGNPALSASAQVFVDIINQNDVRPTFNQTSYSVEVSELLSIGSEIIAVQAFDFDGSDITYDLVEGNEEENFQLNRMTGVITLASSLDYETTEAYTVQIVASDGIDSQLPSGTATVLIYVLDENDNTPVFLNDSYVATILENSTPPTIALIVQASDADSGNNSVIDYAITGTDIETLSLFSINSDGTVAVIDLLDRESRSSYSFTIMASDRGDPPMFSTVQVTVFIADINDNPPIFSEPMIVVNVSESTPLGSDIATFQATDLDTALNAEIVYSLIGAGDLPFVINSSIGIISLNRQLDFEMETAYSIDVIARDQGVPESLSSTAMLEVKVTDFNDNPPVFSEAIYSTAIPENLSIGSSVLRVQASDEDSGVNAIVTFQILAGNQQNKFRINSTTGLITLQNLVNFEQQTEYTLTISANNSEAAVPLASTAIVEISIAEVNEATPTFSENVYEGSVLENEPSGVTVATVMATDTDSGTSGEIMYQITTGNAQNLFEVTVDGGIVTRASLDREQVALHELGVVAFDGGTPRLSSSASVRVTVLDVNDLPPTFSITDPYTASLSENAFSGTAIVTTPPLEASDADSDGPNSEITFQIIDGDPSGVFSIDFMTGQLRSVGAVDFESNDRFELTIEATDAGTPVLSGNATVIITIQDVNDNQPQLLNAPSQVVFTEGQDELLVSENITVVDEDSLPLRLITITLSSPALPSNQIGSLSLATPPSNILDDGLTLEYSGARSPEDVTSLLRTLTFINSDLELDPARRFVTITISDSDFNTRFRIEIQTVLVNDNAPSVDLDTGSPQNGSVSIFIEGSAPIAITRSVSITDGDRGALGLASLTVELLDAEDGASEGLLLSQMTTLDVDYRSDNHSVTLSATQITGFAVFESALSFIYYFNEADEPRAPLTRTIQVTAFDGDLMSLPVTATVNIILENDPPFLILGSGGDYLVEFVEDEGPVLLTSSSQFQLGDSDNEQLQNASVVLLDAPDEDSERILVGVPIPGTLTVTSSNDSVLIEGPAPSADFSTIFRAISYNNVLQNPTTTVRQVEFSVSDGTAQTTATTLVFFSAANDPPILDLNGPQPGIDYRVTFTEESDPIMITSGQLSLQDVDSSFLRSATIQLLTNPDGTRESISLSQFDNPNVQVTSSRTMIQVDGMASINTYSALLRSLYYTNSADEPTRGVREVYFVVNDGFANSTVAVTMIEVLSVNDPPTFILNGGDIYSTLYEEEALSVSIVNPDSTVTLQDSDSASLAYLTVTLSNALDGEAAESISSSDQSLEFTVSRTQAQSNVVFNFTFSSVASNFDNFRRLISSLTYRNTLTEPTAGTRNITFIVSDSIDTSPPQRSSVDVVLVNDNPPVFQQTFYQAQVRENAVGIVVTTVRAMDADSDLGPFASHGIVEYSFLSGNEAGSFSIDPSSGEIRVIIPKDRELVVANPVLMVLASNPAAMSVPSSFPTALVFVTVQDENDNIPQFTDEPYSFSVVEHSSIGTTVGTVIATDADIGTNGQIDYLLSGGNSIFNIDRLMGTLTVADRRRLDREVASSFILSITAMDRGSPATSNTTLVTVQLIDINDNPPLFSSSSYTTTVSESEHVGTTILPVSAMDLDFERNGQVTYSLQGTSVFRVDSSSGEISLASSLDRENQSIYSFNVISSDGGSPSLSSTAQITIDISDENDNPPVFQQSSYSTQVSENLTPGQLVLSVVAIDADIGQNANITYYITGPSVPFEVDPELGTVVTVSSLDRELTDLYTFEIVAEDGGSPSIMSVVPVNITLTDTNDNAPIFSQPSYTANVTENVPIGTVVTRVEASDNDAAENAMLRYSLASSANVFSIDPVTGEIYTASSIDREERDLYQLVVIALDMGQPALSSQVSLTITVLDENDNRPEFEQHVYDFSVFENQPSGEIAILVASDQDQGINARVSYSIVSEDGSSNPFEIDISTGLLSTLGELDRESVPFYNFTALAIDNGSPPLSATAVIMIYVLDENDNSPEFTQTLYSVSVEENFPIGVPFFTVIASDQDLGSNSEIRFELMPETSVGLFSISPHSGELVVLGSLDAEIAIFHYLTIQAQDGGDPIQSSNTTVEVIVVDINDNPVLITLSSTMVTYVEGQPPIFIGPDITITDDDVTSVVVNATVELLTSNSCCEDQLVLTDNLLNRPGVQLLNGNQTLTVSGPLNSTFVSDILGSVQYTNILTEPEANSLTARITTSDGEFSDSVDVTISVATVNDNPPVILLNGSSLNSSVVFMENSPGMPVAALSQITDEDSGPQLLSHISVTLQSPQDGEFLRAQSSGLVSVLPPSGGVSLLLNGPASLSDFRNVLSTVSYHNLEDNPRSPFLRLIQFVANDSELASEPSFAVVTVVPVNDPPYLQLSDDVDFNVTFIEHGPAIQLTTNDILITDPDSPSLLSATVHILDVSDVDSEFLLSPDLTVTSLTLQRVSQSEIRLSGSSPISDYISALRLIRYLNNASNPTSGGRIVEFTVSDGDLSATAIAQVVVEVVNDAPVVDLNGDVSPGLDYQTSFTEGGPAVNIVSSAASISDSDSPMLSSVMITILAPGNGLFERLIPTATFSSISSTFDTTTSTLLLSGLAAISEYERILRSVQYDNSADEPSGRQRQLQVVASDGELNSMPALVTITFLFINDPPIIVLDDGGEYNTVYLEGAPPVSVVNQREAQIMDVDSPSLSYLIAEISNVLDPTEVLNYTDPIGDLLATEIVNSEMQTITYNFSYLFPMSVSVFNSLLVSLNYENQESEPNASEVRIVTILVNDGQLDSNRAISSISIRLIDDNQPAFLQRDYAFVVQEGTAVGSSFGAVVAEDPDLGDSFLYLLTSTEAVPFVINATTGIIQVSGMLDRELEAVYVMQVRLTRPAPPFSLFDDQANVMIEVMDINDNAPVFNQTSFAIEVQEDVGVNDIIEVIVASDSDEGSNAELQYSLSGTAVFQIDPVSGVISTSQALDREVMPSYEFVVSASDGGQPTLSSSTFISVTVLDVNDNAPQFLQSLYFTQLVETVSIGTTVLQLSASDSDIGTNADLTFMLEPSSTLFTINSLTGVVTVLRTLTPGLYNFTAIVTDGGVPQLNSTVPTMIEVISFDSTLPMFSQSIYEGSVLENTPSGTSVLTVNATDPLTGSLVRYTILDSPSSVAFNLDVVSGLLTVSGSVTLDRESNDLYQLQVSATSADMQRVGMAQIVVRILDANDFPPVFTQSFYSFQIIENVNVNFIAGTVLARDIMDIGVNADIMNYSISSSNFSVDSFGVIRTTDMIDREAEDTYVFLVFATDAGSPSQTGSASVTVTVLDENDQAPEFSQAVYEGQVAERQPPGTAVLVVSATDGDINSNAQVTFSSNSSEFNVHPETGLISTVVELDFESNPETIFQVFVFASDSGTPPLTTSSIAQIRIVDIDDSPPQFSMNMYSARIDEGQLSGSLLRVEATDSDSGPNNPISYSIVSGNSNMQFSIDPSGVISVQQPLDRETLTQHTLGVEASNMDAYGNTLSTSATVVIDVLDVNDNAPRFLDLPYIFSVSEGVTGGEVVGILSATDVDEGSNANVTEFIITAGDPRRIFELNSQSGILRIAPSFLPPLDRESNDNFQLTVRVSDSGLPRLSTGVNVTVLITDVNDLPPVFDELASYVAGIRENASIGTVFFDADASDGDLGSNALISYSLSEPSPLFAINMTSGEVYLAATGIDFETQQQYNITLVAVDGGVPQLTGSVNLQINVFDADDLPVQFPLEQYFASIFENEPFGTQVLTVTAQDPDTVQGNPITYSLESTGDVDQLPFSIDSQSGQISVLRPLDRELISEYTFRVFATNTPGQLASTTVTVEVLDVNDVTPTFPSSLFQFQVSESAATGFELGSLTAEDRDTGSAGDVQYSLVNGTSSIIINASTGVLSLASTLDFETVDLYSFTVLAVDGGSPSLSGSSSVIVEVQDINDNPPVFVHESNVTFVPEEVQVGTVIFTAEAEDGDSGSNALFTFSLALPNNQFSIDTFTGEVNVTSTLAVQTYVLTLAVTDLGSPQLSSITTLEVVVTDTNEQPVFTQTMYSVTLSEDHAVGALAIQVTATDPDSGTNAEIEYFIDPEQTFTIERDTGRVLLMQSLDFEVAQSYAITVSAVDSGTPPLTASAQLTIEVMDVNDNVPIFMEDTYSMSVAEDLPQSSTVLFVNAFDADSSSNAAITYSLAGGNDQGLFGINSLSGAIFSLRGLDYEVTERFDLVVAARDGGQPPMSTTTAVTIRITDVDDNPPIFDQDEYPVSIIENAQLGSAVVVVQANDSDSGLNAAVRYSLVNTTEQLPFMIEQESGVIFVSGLGLDRESEDMYVLAVEAFNPFSGRFSSIAMVIIEISDVNDNAPMFDEENLQLSTSEATSVGTVIGQITAQDDDQDLNSIITFTLEPLSLFISIDSETGELTVIRTLDFETTPQLNLIVVARDSGTPQLSASARVQISLQDSNDVPPQISSSTPQFSFQEGSVPIRIGNGIIITDPDTFPLERASVNLYADSTSTPATAFDFIQLDRAFSESQDLELSASSHFISIVGNASVTTYMRILSELEFGNTADEPSIGSRTVQLQVFDGHTFSNILTISITVQPLNDNPPLLDLSASLEGLGFQTVFLEGGMFVFIVESDLTLVDVDGSSIQNISVNLTNGMDGDTERLNALNFGRVRVEVFENAMILQGPASPDEFELALQMIRYENQADEPRNPQIARTIEFIASDGELFSQPVVTTVVIQSVNDPPILQLGPGAQDVILTYSEDLASLLLVSDSLSLSDSDSDLLSFINVTVVDNQPGIDQLRFTIDSNTTMDSNITGEFLSGTLLLSGPATIPEFISVMKTIAYVNSFVLNDQIDQLQGGKTIELSANDGMLSSEVASVFVTFAAVNDPPLLDLNGPLPGTSFSASFEEGDTAVLAVSPQLTVRDVDSQLLQVATVQLSGVLDTSNEVLFTTASAGGIRSVFDARSLILTLTGPATVADFQQVLRSLFYQNSASEPNIGERTLVFVVSDGEVSSTQATSTVTVVGFNDPPQLSFLETGQPFVENETSVPLVLPNTVSLVDADNQTLAYLQATLENALDGSANEVIATSSSLQGLSVEAITAGSSIVFTFAFLPPSLATVQNFASLIAGLTYSNTADEPQTGRRSINVTISDGVDVSASIGIDVDIMLVNDNRPVFANDFEMVSLLENATVGMVVFNSHATDSDEDSEISYSLRNETTLFNISSTDGTVVLSDTLDREMRSQHVLFIEASDGSNVDMLRLLVSVDDINDNAPVFSSNLYRATVNENATVGTSVTDDVFATDVDAGTNGQVRYTITGGNQERTFTIDDRSGLITLSGSLNFENIQTYSLVVTARDFGLPSLSNTTFVIINVIDRNDNPPVFTPESDEVQWDEDTLIGTVLYTAQATDVDENSRLEYSISTNQTQMFSISAPLGNIILEQSLDFEQETMYIVIVEASDGVSVATFELTIIVRNVNDNPPVFVQNMYSISIPENASIGENLLTGLQPLQVVDADLGLDSAVRFFIESGDDRDKFAVNLISSDTAELIVAGGLDRELQEEYNLVIIAQDTSISNFNSSASIMIQILDVNDNAPQFQMNLYNFSVEENSNAGILVGVVQADDIDIGTNGHVTYTIISGDPNGHFIITSEGEIQTSSQIIDRENVCQFTLTVRAEDGGSPTQTALTSILITVLDVNDNPPIFAQTAYMTTLFENSSPGTTLSGIVILAEDNQDIGANAEVMYLIHPNNASLFNVHPVTGILTTVVSFNFESDPTELEITVIATDLGDVPLSAEAQVTVILLDVNEFVPQFTTDQYSASIAENVAVFSSILTVTAEDRDGDTGAFIQYSLFDVDDSLPFTIDNDTGVVRTTIELDREAVESYQFTVVAFNPLGTPMLSSTAAVTIIVTDINDNAPVFVQEDYVAAITRSFEQGNPILTISANDADLGLNGTIRYSLRDVTTRFNIAPSTGVITSTQPFETTGSFMLIVVASDQGTPSLSSNASVTINVVQPVDVQFSQSGAGFLLQQSFSSTLQQQFGLFVNSPPGSFGMITSSLSGVRAEATYFTDLPVAVNLRGVVLNEDAWHDRPEVQVLVQVMDDLGDVHCSPVQVVIRAFPDTTLQSLANINPQVRY